MTDSDGWTIEEVSLQREARAWVGRLVSGDATVAELEEARRWRRQSDAHEAAFAAAARLWDGLGPAGRNVARRHGLPVRFSQFRAAEGRVTRRAVLGGAVAASAVAVSYLAVRPPLGLWPSLMELRADYRTGVGQQRRITVADGVSVEMNTATSLNVRPMAANAVQIELIAGETAVATSATVAGPVIVIAGDGQTSVRSARFNVRHDGAAVCVSCLEGAVHVEHRGTMIALEGRQQVTYGDRALGKPVAIDPVAVSAWQEGLLIFHGTPLAEVVAEINRYRSGRIVLLNAQLARQPVNARFHIDHVDEVMVLVQRVFGARVEMLPGGFVLVS